MKITKLETFTNEFVGFVRLTTEDGKQGWGQVSTYNSDITCQIFHRQIAPWALGTEIEDIETVIDKIPEHEHKYPGSYVLRAMSGLDTAVWDWRGKVAEKPVAELLGGTAGSLRSYASSMRRDITPQDEADRLKALKDKYGFDAFKFRVGAECGRDVDEWPGRTEEVVPTVRKTLGDDVSLLVDGNSGFSAKRAIEVGHMLEANGVEHFEEPCPYWLMEETKQVTDVISLDVTGGEQDCDFQHWKRMMDMGAVNVIQPDILYMGGMIRTMEVTKMGAERGYKCTPHCANLSMVTLFTMHLLRAIPNAGKYLEFSIEGPEYYPWQQELFVKDPYQIVDGHATVTDEPGWGVEISPEWLATSSYQISEL
ncbi:mandelate racemase/muconate lactonizing enzyme family protein [Curvivirga sp.]|uniref:mandelate racemase/muconate lactonizing enzyme family protein n=1 Tax=Curvivirga sp. TaxID=2856848 RepID=UPI003B5A6702